MNSEYALRYEREGWSVVPINWVKPNGLCSCGDHKCKNVGKHPLIAEWTEFQKRRATPEEIKAWWKRWPKANIAGVTGCISGRAIIDDDDRNADGTRFDTLVCRTGGGGFHFHFRLEELIRGLGHDSTDGHTDVKAEGGYVLLPPSNHVNGVYEWFRDAPMAPLPHIVQEWHARKGRSNGTSRIQPVSTGEYYNETGSRNVATTRYVGYLLGSGKTPKDAYYETLRYNDERNRPPLEEKEVFGIVESVWNREKEKRERKRQAKGEYKVLNLMTTDQMFEKYGVQQSWIIPGWLPAGTCCFVTAPPESYKTWLFLELALAVTSGRPFLGKYRVLTPGNVLLIQQEDYLPDTMDRFARLMHIGAAWSDGETDTVPIWEHKLPLWTDDRLMRLDNRDAMDDLERIIQKYDVRLVQIDPFGTFAPLGEDFGTEAGVMINQLLKPLRDRYNTSFLMNHHTSRGGMQSETKGGRKRDSMWGSNILSGALETGWHLRVPVEGGSIVEVSRHTKSLGHEALVRLNWQISDYSAKAIVL